MAADSVRDLVERMYPALATGDRAGVEALLSPEFEAYYSPGLPAPIGGRHVGPQDCIDNGWWAIGARWAVRAAPVRWLDCGTDETGNDELVVLGDYVGKSRRSKRPLNAPFAHAWAARDGRLRSLRQYTDTALWRDALDDSAALEDA
jgi:ketosteroid isomerase-like protein